MYLLIAPLLQNDQSLCPSLIELFDEICMRSGWWGSLECRLPRKNWWLWDGCVVNNDLSSWLARKTDQIRCFETGWWYWVLLRLRGICLNYFSVRSFWRFWLDDDQTRFGLDDWGVVGFSASKSKLKFWQRPIFRFDWLSRGCQLWKMISSLNNDKAWWR